MALRSFVLSVNRLVFFVAVTNKRMWIKRFIERGSQHFGNARCLPSVRVLSSDVHKEHSDRPP